MSDNKSRVDTSPAHHQQKKGQEENVDLDSGFVSSYIPSGPIDSSFIDSSEVKPEIKDDKQKPASEKVLQAQQQEQDMDSAYIDSGLLSSDMSKLEINPQVVLPKHTNNEVYFQCNEDGDT